MAKITAMPSLEIISGFKGIVDFYVHNGIPCARRWPHSPGHRRAPLVEAQWPILAHAAKSWNTIPPEIRQAYEWMASDTGLSARDMFTRAYISGWKKLIATVDELE